MELSSLKQVGINTDSAIERFMGNEELFAKMLKKFLAEPTFAKLTAAAAEGNGQAALEASHTLKGVCGNLSIESLFDLFAEQVVLMRADKWDEAYAMMPEITEKYNLVTDTLKSCLDVQ
ncbi:MAG: Hpt domain-containing protein [Ruminococcus sp.]|nr:Hpt domain-containing protein [Ruminococcus sp.]